MVASVDSHGAGRAVEDATRERGLVCRVRGLLVALPLGDVVETMRPLPVEPLAAMPAFVAGLAVIRGAATAVVDAGALLIGDVPPAWTRFVTVRAGAATFALAVDEVVAIAPIARTTLGELAPLLDPEARARIAGVGAQSGLLLVLDALRLIPDALWERLAAAGARR